MPILLIGGAVSSSNSRRGKVARDMARSSSSTVKGVSCRVVWFDRVGVSWRVATSTPESIGGGADLVGLMESSGNDGVAFVN